ncbi:MAG: family 1 glycosylhydrolase [Clostridia bacterium]|nr:family 1 glycosylhydrolase [Deltaproteobacteria bacterium]
MTGVQMPPLELWAGVECTVNRVGDRWFDQLERTGHVRRLSDCDRIADLGVSRVRYPVLWERPPWHDDRLERLRDRGVAPIVGLMHHGSGPDGTSLLDPLMPEKLAVHARSVAERYPWVRDWTPVNEPLTTARFSALYGHWYPHHHSTQSFLVALVNQCRAIQCAMRAIREVIPEAQLVQTEDFATINASPAIAYQAEYESERRWLSLDLLTGRFDENHALWADHGDDIMSAGAAALTEYPCSPDIFGFNYYLTSDRFLDDRIEHYPRAQHGGNGRAAYVDTSAVRHENLGVYGHEQLLVDAWERYRRPVAITETHAGATREEQMRWVLEAWHGAHAARARGVDVRAVTLWSVFGAYDWTSLVTRNDGIYEPGLYDVRSDPPQSTALAELAKALSNGGAFDHPVLAGPPWWRRSLRYTGKPEPHATSQRQPLLLIGGGVLANALARACEIRGLVYHRVPCEELDVTSVKAVDKAIAQHAPWAVIIDTYDNAAEPATASVNACLDAIIDETTPHRYGSPPVVYQIAAEVALRRAS